MGNASVAARDYTIQHWQNHEQILTGDYDGVSEELESIKCLGNAVVPQIAMLIWQEIKNALEDKNESI